MTDGPQQPDPTAGASPVGWPPAPAPVAKPPAGWYPDPWAAGHHRYWTGEGWTADSFPSGTAESAAGDRPWPGGPFRPEPASPAGGQGFSPVTGTLQSPLEPPPPPAWTVAGNGRDRAATVPPAPDPVLPVEPRRRLSERALIAILVPIGLIVGFVSVAGLFWIRDNRHEPAVASPSLASPRPTFPSGPRPTIPVPPGDPNALALSRLVVTQADVGPSTTVRELIGGDQVSGETTLDLCNGTYASEQLRTARLQVTAVDGQGDPSLSTEAVLYPNEAGTAQAFSELKSVSAQCPAGPVTSPVGEAPVATKFNPPPDGAWPQVAAVERLAFDFVTTDDTGQTHHSVAVYLRRGRVLMGVYFAQADGAQSPVAGQTTIPTIVNVFATRMAQLAPTVVNG